MKLFKTKCYLKRNVKSMKGNLSVVSDMNLYYTQFKHIHNLDKGLAWE